MKTKADELLELTEGHDNTVSAIQNLQWTPQMQVISVDSDTYISIDLSALIAELAQLGVNVSAGDDGNIPSSLMLKVDDVPSSTAEPEMEPDSGMQDA